MEFPNETKTMLTFDDYPSNIQNQVGSNWDSGL